MKKPLSLALLLILAVVPVLAKAIVVTSPAPGTLWQVASHHLITWTSSGISASTQVHLILRQNGTKVGDIVASGVTAGQGSYDWIAGKSDAGQAPAGSGYVVRIRTADGATTGDSGSFALTNALVVGAPPAYKTGAVMPKPGSITLAPLSVIKPAAGDSCDPYNTVYITWRKSVSMDANVSITLLRNGAAAGTIAASAPNVEAFTWDPKPLNPDPGTYTIRLKTLDGAYQADSGGFTMQEAGGIQLLSPSGGEAWPNNSTHDVTWKRVGNIRTVTILLLRNQNTYQTLAQNIDAKLQTKACNFVKSSIDGSQQACYQVMIQNSLGPTTNPSGCLTLAGDPDLAITSMNYNPDLGTGKPVNFSFQVKNIGQVASHPCDGDFRYNNAVQKTFSLPAINPGDSVPVSFTWTYSGPGTAKITIDTGNVNIEPDKTNNVWTTTWMAYRN